MSTSILDDPDIVTAPLLAALRDTGLPVGDGEIPLGHPQRGKPYAVLYPIDGGSFEGPPYWAPDVDATIVYQVTSAGWRRDQCERVAGRLRAVILGTTNGLYTVPLVLDGWRVIGRRPDGGSGGAVKEGDVFNRADRYAITVTPES